MSNQKGPWRITFDTNPDDCNLNCIMCEGFSKYSAQPHSMPRRMDINIIEKVVEETAPLGLTEIIPSTMGEPLLYDHFDDILKLCHQYKIKLNLTTNGTWFRNSPEKWAAKICPVASDVKISLNGATKETQEQIMHGSKYEKRLEDLKRFVKARDKAANESGNRCSITLQLTFMEMNLPELPLIIAQASELKVDRVKGHHIWTHFPQTQNQDLRRNSESRQRWNTVVEQCEKVAYEKRLKLENFHPLTEKSPNLPDEWVCPFLGKEAWINAEGRFDPCCAPDNERKTLGYFGNASQASFTALWKSQAYQELKNNYTSNMPCRKCNMRRPPFNG